MLYRVPREPSTPRIAIWRRLKRLGVAQLGDGLIALPADARTQEQLEWVAEEVEQAGGTASVWRARPMSRAQERRMVVEMAEARAGEYRQLRDRAREAGAGTDPGGVRAALRRLRAEQRRIERRDHFPPPERAEARSALRELAALAGTPGREPA
nr:Chromate resistance protein ChrB [Pseudonocardia sp. C8]